MNLQFPEDPNVLEDKLNDPRLEHGSPVLTQIASVLCIDTATNELVSTSKGKKSKSSKPAQLDPDGEEDVEIAPAPKSKGNRKVKEVSHCCCMMSGFVHHFNKYHHVICQAAHGGKAKLYTILRVLLCRDQTWKLFNKVYDLTIAGETLGQVPLGPPPVRPERDKDSKLDVYRHEMRQWASKQEAFLKKSNENTKKFTRVFFAEQMFNRTNVSFRDTLLTSIIERKLAIGSTKRGYPLASTVLNRFKVWDLISKTYLELIELRYPAEKFTTMYQVFDKIKETFPEYTVKDCYERVKPDHLAVMSKRNQVITYKNKMRARYLSALAVATQSRSKQPPKSVLVGDATDRSRKVTLQMWQTVQTNECERRSAELNEAKQSYQASCDAVLQQCGVRSLYEVTRLMTTLDLILEPAGQAAQSSSSGEVRRNYVLPAEPGGRQASIFKELCVPTPTGETKTIQIIVHNISAQDVLSLPKRQLLPDDGRCPVMACSVNFGLDMYPMDGKADGDLELKALYLSARKLTTSVNHDLVSLNPTSVGGVAASNSSRSAVSRQRLGQVAFVNHDPKHMHSVQTAANLHYQDSPMFASLRRVVVHPDAWTVPVQGFRVNGQEFWQSFHVEPERPELSGTDVEILFPHDSSGQGGFARQYPLLDKIMCKDTYIVLPSQKNKYVDPESGKHMQCEWNPALAAALCVRHFVPGPNQFLYAPYTGSASIIFPINLLGGSVLACEADVDMFNLIKGRINEFEDKLNELVVDATTKRKRTRNFEELWAIYGGTTWEQWRDRQQWSAVFAANQIKREKRLAKKIQEDDDDQEDDDAAPTDFELIVAGGGGVAEMEVDPPVVAEMEEDPPASQSDSPVLSREAPSDPVPLSAIESNVMEGAPVSSPAETQLAVVTPVPDSVPRKVPRKRRMDDDDDKGTQPVTKKPRPNTKSSSKEQGEGASEPATVEISDPVQPGDPGPTTVHPFFIPPQVVLDSST